MKKKLHANTNDREEKQFFNSASHTPWLTRTVFSIGMFDGHDLPPGFTSHSAAAAAAAAAGYLPSPFALMTSQSLPFMHQPGVAGIYSSPAGLMFAPALHHPAHHQAALAALHQQQQQQLNGLQEQEAAAMNSLLGKRGSPTPHPGHLTSPNHLDMSTEAKKARIQSSMRILKDEPVPEGYIRFRWAYKKKWALPNHSSSITLNTFWCSKQFKHLITPFFLRKLMHISMLSSSVSGPHQNFCFNP